MFLLKKKPRYQPWRYNDCLKLNRKIKLVYIYWRPSTYKESIYIGYKSTLIFLCWQRTFKWPWIQDQYIFVVLWCILFAICLWGIAAIKMKRFTCATYKIAHAKPYETKCWERIMTRLNFVLKYFCSDKIGHFSVFPIIKERVCNTQCLFDKHFTNMAWSQKYNYNIIRPIKFCFIWS